LASEKVLPLPGDGSASAIVTTKTRLLILLAAGAITLPACKKPPPPPLETYQMFGVSIELGRLRQEFQNTSPELEMTTRRISSEAHQWRLAQAMVDLDKLGNAPGLTDSQKKAVNDVMDQVKDVLAKNATPQVR
jgi:hypothetical protein